MRKTVARPYSSKKLPNINVGGHVCRETGSPHEIEITIKVNGQETVVKRDITGKNIRLQIEYFPSDGKWTRVSVCDEYEKLERGTESERVEEISLIDSDSSDEGENRRREASPSLEKVQRELLRISERKEREKASEKAEREAQCERWKNDLLRTWEEQEREREREQWG